jgi:ABC-type uncharacterized transport system substrate-binding protein
MRELGYLERRDYGVEERFAEGDLRHLQSVAEELVRLRPDVIVAGASVAALTVKKLTSIIPIVGANLIDPVRFGLATTETRPGTNVTGTLMRLEGLTGKQLEMGLELVPGATKIAFENDRCRHQSRELPQNRIGYLLKRPVGRPPNEVRRYYANFRRQAGASRAADCQG